MKITFEDYGKFDLSLNYADGTYATYCGENDSASLRDCMNFIEMRMSQDLTIVSAYLCDAETGEIVLTITRENEDFIQTEEKTDQIWYPWDDYFEDGSSEFGYDPYMGSYSYDC